MFWRVNLELKTDPVKGRREYVMDRIWWPFSYNLAEYVGASFPFRADLGRVLPLFPANQSPAVAVLTRIFRYIDHDF